MTTESFCCSTTCLGAAHDATVRIAAIAIILFMCFKSFKTIHSAGKEDLLPWIYPDKPHVPAFSRLHDSSI